MLEYYKNHCFLRGFKKNTAHSVKTFKVCQTLKVWRETFLGNYIRTENRNWQLVIYKSVLPSPLVQNRWAFEKREASYTNQSTKAIHLK
ncbi:MAG: hypothetical protein DRR19_03355 [Candidatus Parabeggiatoa sp. nov. 1]|nr:MAG: hypothetical protein DRR19_03355 [Gammaproteobacteria bacterium]